AGVGGEAGAVEGRRGREGVNGPGHRPLRNGGQECRKKGTAAPPPAPPICQRRAMTCSEYGGFFRIRIFVSHRARVLAYPESQDGPNGEFCGPTVWIRCGLFRMSQSRLIISRSVRD